MSNPVFKTNHPFGDVDVIAVTAAGTMAATIEEQVTHLTISEMSAAGTLNLTLGSEVKPGAKLVIMATADGTNRNLTFGTGITGNVLQITANKTFIITAEKVGASFIVSSTLVVD
jgi:hypothetical protein